MDLDGSPDVSDVIQNVVPSRLPGFPNFTVLVQSSTSSRVLQMSNHLLPNPLVLLVHVFFSWKSSVYHLPVQLGLCLDQLHISSWSPSSSSAAAHFCTRKLVFCHCFVSLIDFILLVRPITSSFKSVLSPDKARPLSTESPPTKKNQQFLLDSGVTAALGACSSPRGLS